ncbi:MAG TPA: hypothetical protein P5571_10035 [Candidatus Krumholzibacteria bacterium]|nr:hypothetical protein [Candidatus Krumholzibacteria bacterium]HRX51693.1 hypothetical protein [Candidatus Krumholzibacteria bacterium]
MTHVTRRLTAWALLLAVAVPALAQRPLDYWDYTAAMRAAERLDHLCAVASLEDPSGPVLAVGDRFGLVRLLRLVDGQTRQLWVSKQLRGQVMEVLAADLDGDDRDELVAWTDSGNIYLWSAHEQRLLWESLTNDYNQITAVALGQVDDDEPLEIVVNADNRIHYVDGQSYTRQWTSPYEYTATRLRVGDVDGDGESELVLSTGQVVGARNGDVEWDSEVFGTRLELLDIDADGIPEILAENDGALMRIYDADVQREKQLQ